MRTGHVAMLEILGGKGISKRHRGDVARILNSVAGHARFSADRLVLAIERSERSDADRHPDVQRGVLARQVGHVIHRSACLKLPLTSRGAIAEGAFVIADNVILGPAVDEAAEAMIVPNAALVWMSGTRLLRPAQPATVFDYAMPLHDGNTVRVQVLNPFMLCQHDQDLEAVEHGIMKPFAEPRELALRVTQRNTAAFLSAARERWRELQPAS